MRDVARRINGGLVGNEYGASSSARQSPSCVLGASGGGSRSSVASSVAPSAVSLASSSISMVGGGGGGGGAGVSATSFEDFCDSVRFPNSMSRLLRVRCYLLASQGHVLDFTKHTERVVPPDVSRSINDNGITFPDVQCLCNGIETLTMNVAPFPEINAFRQRCFSSFAINQRRGLTLTQVGLVFASLFSL